MITKLGVGVLAFIAAYIAFIAGSVLNELLFLPNHPKYALVFRLLLVGGTYLLGRKFYKMMLSGPLPALILHNLTCVRCGYDLTGNESGVCPECGTKR